MSQCYKRHPSMIGFCEREQKHRENHVFHKRAIAFRWQNMDDLETPSLSREDDMSREGDPLREGNYNREIDRDSVDSEERY